MKYVSCLLLVLLAACGNSEDSRKYLVNRVASATFAVQGKQEIFGGIIIGGGHGSGFYIINHRRNLLVTAGHVCEHLISDPSITSSEIVKKDFLQANPKVVKIDKDVDLCALDFNPPEYLLPLVVAKDITYPEEVMTAGYPLHDPFTVSFGFALGQYRDQLFPSISQFNSAPVFPGNSGGPLVKMNGEVVGVVSEGDNESHYGFTVSLENIHNFLREIL